MSKGGVESRLGPEIPGMSCVGFLGSGGYAEVFLYERERPRMEVAVKILRPDVMNDDAKVRQFTAEADLMATMADHPFIVPVIEAGNAPDGRPYMAMKYYHSGTLEQRVASAPLSVPDALRYGVQLASAVETAHLANVIHRDIKPSNVLLDRYDRPGLGDFGIAGLAVTDEDDGDLVGMSLAWAPPEVARWESNGSVTADVYSLAATIWTVLVGRAPFQIPGGDNSSLSLRSRTLHSRPPATGRGDVPASLDRLLQGALAKSPARRPQSALELARNFRRVEQELQLTPTEIVVLDQETGRPAGGSPAQPLSETYADSASGSAETASEPAADATQRKAARHVPSSQSPRPSAPSGFRQAATAADGTKLQLAPPAEPRAPRPHDANASQPTTRRPTIAAPDPIVLESASAPKPNRRMVAGGLAVAVAAAVGAAVALSGGGQAPTSSQTGTGGLTSQQTETTPADALPSAAANPSPVTAAVKGRIVSFSWPAVAGVGEYRWTLSDGTTGTTAGTTVRVRLPAGGTCLTVLSVVPGVPSAAGGGHACAK